MEPLTTYGLGQITLLYLKLSVCKIRVITSAAHGLSEDKMESWV